MLWIEVYLFYWWVAELAGQKNRKYEQWRGCLESEQNVLQRHLFLHFLLNIHIKVLVLSNGSQKNWSTMQIWTV